MKYNSVTELKDLLEVKLFYEEIIEKYSDYETAKEKLSKKALEKRMELYFSPLNTIKDTLSEYETVGEMLEAIKSFNYKAQEIYDDRNNRAAVVFESLGENVKSALENTLEGSSFFDYKEKDGELSIVSDISDSYRRTLNFCNSHVTGKLHQGYVFWYELDKTQSGYSLRILTDEDEEEEFVTIEFSDISIKMEVYSGMNCVFGDNPWEYLGNVANEICSKEELPDCELNSEEKKLLPIAHFLRNCFYNTFSEDEGRAFILIAEQNGFGDIKKYVEKVLQKEKESSKTYRQSLLISQLCLQKYEPLWRVIYNMLQKSQSEYPSMAEKVCDEDYLAGIRCEITEVLREKGYSGEYPDFYRSADSSKRKFAAKSYGDVYFAGGRKKSEYRIKCVEYTCVEGVTVEFICTSHFSGKKDDVTITDVYSNTFNSKGKSFFRVMPATFSEDEEMALLMEAPSVKEFAEVAVKKAELIKLDKNERKNFYFQTEVHTSPLFIIICFLFSGVLFGLLLTIGLMLISCLLTLIVSGSFIAVGEMILEIPWWQYFLFAAVAFGGMMAIFTFINDK